MTQFFFDYILPNHYQIASTINYFNYGMIEFKWGNSKEESSIKLDLNDINGVKLNQIEILYKTLIFSNKHENDSECEIRFNSRIQPLKYYFKKFKESPIIITFYFFFVVLLIQLMINFILFFVCSPCKIFKCCFKVLKARKNNS